MDRESNPVANPCSKTLKGVMSYALALRDLLRLLHEHNAGGFINDPDRGPVPLRPKSRSLHEIIVETPSGSLILADR